MKWYFNVVFHNWFVFSHFKHCRKAIMPRKRERRWREPLMSSVKIHQSSGKILKFDKFILFKVTSRKYKRNWKRKMHSTWRKLVNLPPDSLIYPAGASWATPLFFWEVVFIVIYALLSFDWHRGHPEIKVDICILLYIILSYFSLPIGQHD